MGIHQLNKKLRELQTAKEVENFSQVGKKSSIMNLKFLAVFALVLVFVGHSVDGRPEVNMQPRAIGDADIVTGEKCCPERFGKGEKKYYKCCQRKEDKEDKNCWCEYSNVPMKR